MAFKGVNVNQLNGGLGRHDPTKDGVCLLVVGSAVAASGLALKTAKEYLSLANAEADGITASYDDTNSILAHYHADEFFRIAPDGELYVILDDNTLTDAELTAILKEKPEIKAVGFVRNAANAPADFPAYVAQKQAIVNSLKVENRNIAAMFVEGKEFDAGTAVSDYADMRAIGSGNVSVVISQDPVIRALKTAYETHASIGAALGAFAVRSVNENLGSVDINNKPNYAKGNTSYPLTDIARGRFLTSVLQNGVSISGLSPTEVKALNDKGYIFAGSYNAFAGVYFNDSHTAIEKASDYCRVENNRVWNKAADLIVRALMPRVKGNFKKDPATGHMREVEATELEALAKKELQIMESAGEISGYDVFIDPAQDLSNDVPLNVKAQVVLNGIIHQFEVDLGLTNKIQ